MALGPKDLLSLTSSDVEAVDKLEKLIDEKLTTAYEPPGTFQTNLLTLGDQIKCPKISYKMKKELLTRYEKVGWNVSLGNDQNSLVFAGPALPAPEPDLIPNTSVDEMMDKMAKAKKSPPTGHKPPVIMPMTRADSPYKQKD